jgi:hypothetical protein
MGVYLSSAAESEPAAPQDFEAYSKQTRELGNAIAAALMSGDPDINLGQLESQRTGLWWAYPEHRQAELASRPNTILLPPLSQLNQ